MEDLLMLISIKMMRVIMKMNMIMMMMVMLSNIFLRRNISF